MGGAPLPCSLRGATSSGRCTASVPTARSKSHASPSLSPAFKQLGRPAGRLTPELDALPGPSRPPASPQRHRLAAANAGEVGSGSSEASSSRQGGGPAGPAEEPPKDPVLVKVRISVHYRVHSRQMLCVGGSEMPFGWSFLSIAKVPMIWSDGDIWWCEVDVPAGTRIEYKYVILEEQDWTKQENQDAEGVATFTYRTVPDEPPDFNTIQKKMAIVAWQPGPNRTVQVPPEAELQSMKPGEVRQQRFAKDEELPLPSTPVWPYSPAADKRPPPASGGTVDENLGDEWEVLSLLENGLPLLERRDVWGISDRKTLRQIKGLHFGA